MSELILLAKTEKELIEETLISNDIKIDGTISQFIKAAELMDLSLGETLLIKSPFFERELRNNNIKDEIIHRIVLAYNCLVVDQYNKIKELEEVIENSISSNVKQLNEIEASDTSYL